MNHSSPARPKRVLILISLGMNRQLSFTDLLELTGASKGSLSHHLDQLSAAGLTRSRMVFTLGGPRIRVEITPEGVAVYENLTRLLAGLAPRPADGTFSAQSSR